MIDTIIPINKMTETIRNWAPYIGSVGVGSMGFIDSLNQYLDLLFVSLGCIGLILSIILTVKKIRALNNKP
jgi:hypothetical protein